MAWRFRRSIKIAPGIRINLNKKSASVRIGPRGLGHTISSTGKRTTSVGIPGSGLSYSETSSTKQRRSTPQAQHFAAIADGTPQSSKPKPSIFQGILTVAFLLFGVSFCASQFNSSKDKPIEKAVTVAQSTISPEQPLGLIQSPSNASNPDAISARRDKSAIIEKIMFTKSRANIRNEASTASRVVKTIDTGTPVKVLNRVDGWMNVSHLTITGWIAESLLAEHRSTPAQRNTQPSTAPSKSPERTVIRPRTPNRSNNGYQRGPRGGCYYYTASGNKRYVDRSLCS